MEVDPCVAEKLKQKSKAFLPIDCFMNINHPNLGSNWLIKANEGMVALWLVPCGFSPRFNFMPLALLLSLLFGRMRAQGLQMPVHLLLPLKTGEWNCVV
jgi:hypothetical protein